MQRRTRSWYVVRTLALFLFGAASFVFYLLTVATELHDPSLSYMFMGFWVTSMMVACFVFSSLIDGLVDLRKESKANRSNKDQ